MFTIEWFRGGVVEIGAVVRKSKLREEVRSDCEDEDGVKEQRHKEVSAHSMPLKV